MTKNYKDDEMTPVCKNNILETENDGVLYLFITNDKKKLIAGTACNMGLLQHYDFDYDDAFSLDENLQAFIEEIENT